jgi:tartrate dehydrogenase/decarboxylase/D-malate dehydrogenase
MTNPAGTRSGRRSYRSAVVAGDGIGPELVPEGIRVLDPAGRRLGIDFAWEEFGWGCGHYARSGRMMPEDGLEQISAHDAIYLGAVGDPKVPDHVSLWGPLIPIRRHFEQYVNLCLIRLLPGIVSPLCGRSKADIDLWRRPHPALRLRAGGRMSRGAGRRGRGGRAEP